MTLHPFDMDINSLFAQQGQPDNEKSIQWKLERLTHWDMSVKSSQTIRETLKMLDGNPKIPGVMVLEGENLIGLIPRERIYEKLGRPFGVELFLKRNARNFYEMLGITTLVLPSQTTIDEAVKIALTRQEGSLYDPIVIKYLNGYSFISMFTLLMEQQTILQDLYSQVYRLSTEDPLTLVNNRRGFFESVNPQLESIHHLNLEYAVLMIDIDNFKQINDRYGHQVGDEVIKSVAQRISKRIHEKDVLGRFGGEEFVVFVPGISRDAALNLAENLRQEIAGYFHIINWFQIRATISIGVSHSVGANHTFDRLLTQSDQAVYAAKNKGRNRVIIWDEGLNLSPTIHNMFRMEKSDHLVESDSTQTLQGMLRMLYLRDLETETHTKRVAEITLLQAEKFNVPDEELDGMYIGALLHDIGKIAIPDKILLKRGKLTKAEWEIMQRHPQYAYDLLSPISYFQHALDIPYCHHEHWDGHGYPRGLQEKGIPLAARIFTIVDVWDALSSDRPYRTAWAKDDIKKYLKEQAGIIFDPALVELFIEHLDEDIKPDRI